MSAGRSGVNGLGQEAGAHPAPRGDATNLLSGQVSKPAANERLREYVHERLAGVIR